MKFKIDTSKLMLPLLGVILVFSPVFGHAQADVKQWTITKDTAESYITTITKDFNTVRVQFPSDIKAQNTKVSIIRDLPEIPLSISSSSGAGTADALADQAKFNQANCKKLGLDGSCGLNINLNDYSLGSGDSLEIKVEFTAVVDGEPKIFNKTGRFTRLKRGTFRLGVGTLFVLSDSDNYLTRPEGDGHQVYSTPGDDLSLNLAATVTWVPYTSKFSDWSSGPTIGVGTDADNLSVFLGYSGIFRRAWTLTGGIAAVKENKLNSQYEVGQIVPEAVDSSTLTTSAYKARFFIGLTWTPAAK